jgi:hypothetical protein
MSNPAAVIPCPSCDAALAGEYCAACGQRAPRASDFTLAALAREAWRELSGSDSRLWRTVLGLFQPGVLTLGWLQYRRRAYLPPLRLYLLVSAAFFLLAWDAYFQSQLLQMRDAPPGAIPEAVRAMYADPLVSESISDWSAFYRFAGVLALGLFVKLLHWRKRLPIGKHLVFATHYYCADFVIFLLASPLVYFTPASAYASVMTGVTVVGMAWLGWWAVLADRRVYGGGWGGNVLRGLAVLVADAVISVVAGQLAVLSVYLTRG